MNEITNWCAWIVTCSALCVLVEFFIPQGQATKSINIILSLFILGSTLHTLFNKKQNLHFDFALPSKTQVSKENTKFLNNINAQIENFTSDTLKATIREYLADYKINPKKIDIFMDKNKDNCIVMVRCKIYIDKEYIALSQSIKPRMEQKLKLSIEFVEI